MLVYFLHNASAILKVQHNTIQQQQQQQHQIQAMHQAMHQGYSHPHQLSAATAAMHQHPHHPHHHSVISQYPVPQMTVTTQAFSPQGANTFVSVPPMTTVIQHRMSSQQGGVAALGGLGPSTLSSHQKIGSSPACAVTSGGNFYIQPNPHGHTPTPTPVSVATSTVRYKLHRCLQIGKRKLEIRKPQVTAFSVPKTRYLRYGYFDLISTP